MSRGSSLALLLTLRGALLIAPALCVTATADAPPDPVHWSTELIAKQSLNGGAEATVEISGLIDDGWHLYALEQLPHGPTPLRITLDPNSVATLASPASGSTPEKAFSASFGLNTQYYTHSFAIRLPVQLSKDLVAGPQQIPLSVHFQACSDHECLLPRTLHLSIAINVPARN